METMSDVLLLMAVQAWCEECAAVQLLLPTDDEGGADGLCCTVCDAAVFVEPGIHARPAMRRSA